MALSIVTVNVAQTNAPAPSTLQGTGALISQGGTNTAQGTKSLLTQLSDLTPLLAAARAITTITWSGGVATVTTAAPHGYTVGDVVGMVIAGTSPTAYSGSFTATITGAGAFTYPLASNPGAIATPGTYLLADESELLAMATTWFAQGTNLSVYVLELGEGTATEGVAALSTYITANPNTNQSGIYAYLVPREWDANSSFISFLASFENTTAKTYFFVTTTVGTYTNYTSLMKCVYMLIEAPGISALEFSCASNMWVMINYAPSSINLVTPFAYSYVYGVTPYPTVGNAALRTTLKTAHVNIIGLGTEGGITNTIILYGTFADGNPVNYWYSVDWVQINIDLDLANAIINGSNNPQNPLYYNQPGINRLQAVAQGTMNRGISFGLVFPPATVTAVPFAQYVIANPSDYPAGLYRGLGVTYTPLQGFTNITFNVQVTQFPAGL